MLHTHLEKFYFGIAHRPAWNWLPKPARPPSRTKPPCFERGLNDPHRFAETLARIQGPCSAQSVLASPVREASLHPDAFHLQPYNAKPFPFPKRMRAPLVGVAVVYGFRPTVTGANRAQRVAAGLSLLVHRAPARSGTCADPGIWKANWWERGHWLREEWGHRPLMTVFYRLVRAEEGWFS